MNKSDVIKMIVGRAVSEPAVAQVVAFAPTNIALCKYWGKRDVELNLPLTSSLSVSVPKHGATVQLSVNNSREDNVTLNGTALAADSVFVQRLVAFLNLFRGNDPQRFQITITMNIPVAAGLASSAAGFASIVLALNELYAWNLPKQQLSILARLGSGSAARSLWSGFVEWHAGVLPDGSDSYAEPLSETMPTLCMGIIPLSNAAKPIGSTEAMLRTAQTSTLFESWPKKVAHDLGLIRQAIQRQQFSLLAGIAESNALSMHATMLSSWPPICYALPETIAAMQRVWALRKTGQEIYFTQDAGPNLKLLFETGTKEAVAENFPTVNIIPLFHE